MHYRRGHTIATAPDLGDGSTNQNVSDSPQLTVSSLIDKRDFLGAITVIEFENELKKSKKKAKQRGNENDNNKEIENLETLAWCHFHLGLYDKAISIYFDLYDTHSSDPRYNLSIACCLFHLGKYEEAHKFAKKSPSNRLQNRLLLHLYEVYYKDEKKMLESIEKLSESAEDQLCLAAIHFNRSKFQDATSIYKKEWMKNKKVNIAIQIYVAFCFFELDRYDTSNDIIGPYLNKYPSSMIALNLMACNNYRLYNGKVAIQIIQNILDIMQITNCANPFFNIIKHNVCVFRDGENALEVLPPLIDMINEARLNLCIYYLKNEDYVEAYQVLHKHIKIAKTAIEYTLKAIVASCIGQIKQSEKELKIAIKYFELVGSSSAECDTIPGRQCMASFHILNKNFDDVLIYLDSIKEYMLVSQDSSDVFNYNHGISLSHNGKFKEAENVLLSIQNPTYKVEYCYLSHLSRCYIMNGRPWESWNLYLQSTNDINGTANDGNANWNLLYLLAHDCYKVGQFYYAAKAFDALESLEPTTEYWNGKRGACCGVFQQVIAGKEMKEHLLDVMQMLSNDTNPQANFILRVIRQWCHENNIQDY